MALNLSYIFGEHSGSSLLKTAQNIAQRALDGNPSTKEDGSVAKDEQGRAYDDPNKARASISNQEAQLQERVMRNLQGNITQSGAEDIRENLNTLRRLEVARVCVDIFSVHDGADAQGLRRQLNNAMNGLNPTNPSQGAMSRTLENTLNDKLEPATDSPRNRVDIQVSHNGAF